MIQEDLFTAVIYVVHVSDTPRAAVSRYSVTDRNILQVATTLESTHEQRDTPLVES